jgi:molybdenum cofactor cytidylyltransferase
MSRTLSLCGVILAAGDSTRMGTEKALLPWPPNGAQQASTATFLSAAIHALSSSTDMVIVVCGRNTQVIAPTIYAAGASLVTNLEPDRGQFSSLQVGLQEVLNRGRDAAMVTLVDRPPVNPETIEVLADAFVAAARQWKWAVVPQFAGRHGHPIVLGRQMIESFLKAPSTTTARDVEHQFASHIEYVAVEDPMIVANINTPEEYAALRGQGASVSRD